MPATLPDIKSPSTDTVFVLFEDLGLTPYQDAWEYQTLKHKALVEHKLQNRHVPAGTYPQRHTLIFTEHHPVFTLGKSGSMDHLLLSEEQLTARGIQFFPINRGGDITFHGPGQIVGYPILDLDCFFTDVHKYVRFLEEAVIRTLAHYGVEGYRVEGYTGVWVKGPPRSGKIDLNSEKQRKICAIGVHLSRWVTLHGWAFNINTDLSYFDYIVPCGIAEGDKTVTSLQRELGHAVDTEAVKQHLKGHFADLFQCRFV
jgi:lipoyl(octanoyl) transferase